MLGLFSPKVPLRENKWVLSLYLIMLQFQLYLLLKASLLPLLAEFVQCSLSQCKAILTASAPAPAPTFITCTGIFIFSSCPTIALQVYSSGIQSNAALILAIAPIHTVITSISFHGCTQHVRWPTPGTCSCHLFQRQIITDGERHVMNTVTMVLHLALLVHASWLSQNCISDWSITLTLYYRLRKRCMVILHWLEGRRRMEAFNCRFWCWLVSDYQRFRECIISCRAHIIVVTTSIGK